MNKIIKILDKTLLFLALLSFIGAIIYKLYSLNFLGVFISLLLSISIYFIIQKKYQETNTRCQIDSSPYSHKKLLLIFLFLVNNFLVIYKLLEASTTSSLISPWEVVSNKIFILLFINFLILSGLVYLKCKFIIFWISIQSLVINIIVIIIYKLGFGFDFFIHEATMELISEKGFVNPKPLYYLGQYSLVIILNKVSFIPLHLIHLLLVPLLASIYIPIYCYRFLYVNGFSSRSSILTTTFFMSLPLGIFYLTTPQNFAFLLLLLSILIGLIARNKSQYILNISLSLAAIVSQAIAGIPALLFSIFLIIKKSHFGKYKKTINSILFISASTLIPIAFIIASKKNNSLTQGQNENGLNLLDFFNFGIPNSENIFLNTIYLFEKNLSLFFVLSLIVAIYWTIKKKVQNTKLLIILIGGLIISLVLSSKLSFSFLIDYERGDFLLRIIKDIVIISYPIMLLLFATIFKNIFKLKITQQIFFYIFFSTLFVIFIYINYPRFDNYHNSHGYSMSNIDLQTVEWIENNSKENYIVLANQQTSVAALKKFGFNNYYTSSNGEEIFYYPIPTGAKLYKYYLQMVNEKPSRETMLEAMDLAQVNTAYFCLSKFWWAFPKLLEEAKLEADSWEAMSDGDIYIFKFTR
ncbi:hypothetical protein C0583_01195 [Candidatus Parcubacteria bacterium]|nr:MAG: hypothetical protein C0583_01195 [Candidatus Parcubacteria bacterium]